MATLDDVSCGRDHGIGAWARENTRRSDSNRRWKEDESKDVNAHKQVVGDNREGC